MSTPSAAARSTSASSSSPATSARARCTPACSSWSAEHPDVCSAEYPPRASSAVSASTSRITRGSGTRTGATRTARASPSTRRTLAGGRRPAAGGRQWQSAERCASLGGADGRTPPSSGPHGWCAAPRLARQHAQQRPSPVGGVPPAPRPGAGARLTPPEVPRADERSRRPPGTGLPPLRQDPALPGARAGVRSLRRHRRLAQPLQRARPVVGLAGQRRGPGASVSGRAAARAGGR